MSDALTTDTSFQSLDLPAPLLQGLNEMGLTHCTPIQAQTLPLSLAGTDIAGQAQTGTGKTAAFLIAVMSHLLKNPVTERRPNQARALIVAPTRELAIQIHKDAIAIGAHIGLKSVVVYGGSGYEQQRQEVSEGVDILIGTPGRLIDYFKQHVFDLRKCQALVLDEADRMFDLGFIKDIRYLMRRLPPREQRLNLLFSATLSYRVTELAYEHMDNPEIIRVESEQVTADKVVEEVYYPASEEKIPLLLGLLKKLQPPRSIVFINTKHVAEKVSAYLEGNGYPNAILSGDVPQNKRISLLKRFQEGELNILVATDVASRGLHIDAVTHVFNYDLPQDAEDYVHRIGRTARAGASGEAISFACEDYAMSLMDIEEYIQHKIPRADINDDLLATSLPPAKREPRKRPQGKRQGRPGGGRGGGEGSHRHRRHHSGNKSEA
ncbi:MAG: ATP-dependent RNA helicase RhlB [Gammaproteobacteria bacterium]|nr:ATP-dependent RNA helicase RhlB [Gammaproteobacteria bacterium]